LKKRLGRPRTEKLLLLWAMGVGLSNAHGPAKKSLFASFSSEKEALTSLT
jgi:hypothetical protein